MVYTIPLGYTTLLDRTPVIGEGQEAGLARRPKEGPGLENPPHSSLLPIALIRHHCNFTQESWDSNLEVGTEAEATEYRCLLSCSSWLSQPAFLYKSVSTTCPSVTASVLDPSHINHESSKCPTDLPIGIFSAEVPSNQVWFE